ncbi:MAG: hypothetical protein GF344_00505 [Chitinivibrionales bacterium]|nr:hypothetical protein [Chitinivibrionales bacterium]MBD3355608.1 hypothetical protein [Chitinivibrionales bacterium]
MQKEGNKLPALVDMSDPAKVIGEVEAIVTAIDASFDFAAINLVFGDIRALFEGNYPGYRDCNTEYHDLRHTTDCLLAFTRILHGMTICGKQFERDDIELGLMAAMFHDCGYIQTEDDEAGTGAKYTSTHIDRGIDFMKAYFAAHDFPERYGSDGAAMIRCTGLGIDIGTISFTSPAVERLGKALGSADLLGQMADRIYLEKLLFLYYEFAEGGIPGFDSEIKLLDKTLEFYDAARRRLDGDLDNLSLYAVDHFREYRYLNADLYTVAIQRNIEYLRHILNKHRTEHREYLRRGDVVKKLREKGL